MGKFLLYIILFLGFLSKGQKVYVEQPRVFLSTELDSIYPTLEAFDKAIRPLKLKALEAGYLAFGVRYTEQDSSWQCKLDTGAVYQWQKLSYSLKLIAILPSNFREQKDVAFNLKSFYQQSELVVKYFQNRGYPFAALKLDSLELDSNVFNAVLGIDQGALYVWDTLKVDGDATIKKAFLQQYLEVVPGKVYNESVFTQVEKRLKELPFVQLKGKPYVEFSKGKAKVIIPIAHKSANMVNGVIGVLPQTQTGFAGAPRSNLLLTGDIQLNLGSLFNYGELIKLNWRRLQPETQQLSTKEELPYFAGSKWGINHQLDLLKQDSSYVNYSNRLGLQFALGAKRKLIAFWQTKGTNQLGVSTLNSGLSSSTGNSNAYGFALEWNALDYKFNPRKGFYFEMDISAGTKVFSGSDEAGKVKLLLSSTNDVDAFILVDKQSVLYQGNWLLEFYVPVFKLGAIKLANHGGVLLNGFMLDNDLYRVGGFTNLRGFDEQSLFTSAYTVGTLEYRILFEQNSNLSIFYDQGYLEKSTITSNEVYFPYGFGAGLNFQTKPGIFSVSYALGSIAGNPVEFSAAKIHFGFVNLF